MVDMNAIQGLVEAIKEPSEDTNKTYNAVVSRIDNNGVAWVYLAGSEKETPTASTSAEISRGDIVNVEWRNNKLYIAGNATNPSAGVIRVEAVEQAAEVAREAAANAVQSAGEAHAAAEDAKATAGAVHDIAVQASEDAEDAKESATTANTAANGALSSLSTVQDVIGVLDWASKNAEYTLTSDTAITPGKTYWTRSGAGTEADPYVYTPVVNPVVADIGTYYEISGVDEAMADYINSHLALTDEGLYVLADGSEWKVLIASDGVYIQNTLGQTVGKFAANGVYLGDVDGATYLTMDSNGLGVTVDGGSTQSIEAKVAGGSPTSRTDTISNVLLYGNGSGSGFSNYDHNLNEYIVTGQTISITASLQSPASTGDTYTESFSFTAGTQDVKQQFVYEQYSLQVSYDGARHIVFWNLYPHNVILKDTTITYSVELDRATHFTFGHRVTDDPDPAVNAVGNYSLAEGNYVTASGDYSHAEGYYSMASGIGAHAEGYYTGSIGRNTASGDYGSHAEGYGTDATGDYGSHAEGYYSEATANSAHAEGNSTHATERAAHAEGGSTYASGEWSHAEGNGTRATKQCAHSEGGNTRATGLRSHAQNYYTIAASANQTALGKYNVEDANSTYAVIVGNGTADTTAGRSNAATLDWSGNLVTAGDITDGTGNVLSDKIGEDANGDISITRNITAGGNVEAAGDVTDGAGNTLSALAQVDYLHAQTSASQTLTNSNVTIVNLSTVTRKEGSRLSFSASDKAVVIGSGVKYVEVFGEIYYTTHTSNGTRNVYIYNNNTIMARGIINVTTQYNTVCTSGVFAVSQGDKITLRAQGNNGAVIGAEGYTTKLIVRVIN